MKILVADDHTLVREGLIRVLQEAFSFADIDGVSDAVDLIKKITKKKYDIIISDITMPPGDSGIDAIKHIKQISPCTPVLIMSMYTPEQYAVRAFRAGAKGYLTKDAASHELVTAVNLLLAGKRYLSPRVATVLADSVENSDHEKCVDNLSNREYEVFKLLASGKTISGIAAELILSSNTISTFRSKLCEKMGFHNNLELIKFAVDQHMV
ncbi:MAG: response regulator transcription factor [Sediminibacterium sp.]